MKYLCSIGLVCTVLSMHAMQDSDASKLTRVKEKYALGVANLVAYKKGEADNNNQALQNFIYVAGQSYDSSCVAWAKNMLAYMLLNGYVIQPKNDAEGIALLQEVTEQQDDMRAAAYACHALAGYWYKKENITEQTRRIYLDYLKKAALQTHDKEVQKDALEDWLVMAKVRVKKRDPIDYPSAVAIISGTICAYGSWRNTDGVYCFDVERALIHASPQYLNLQRINDPSHLLKKLGKFTIESGSTIGTTINEEGETIRIDLITNQVI